MVDILAEICAHKQESIAAEKRAIDFNDMEVAAKEADPVRGFETALTTALQTHKYALITEIKKASPSAGLIRPDFDPVAIAKEYEAAGAACLSILTDTPYFQGMNQYLIDARAAVSLPVLRKDFMIDPWQIVQSRALGADCILLIMACLSEAQAKELHHLAVSYEMDVLLEVHNESELEQALTLDSGLIGINNRNLKTLVTDIAMTERLAPLVPEGRTIISESGLYKPSDLARMAKAGASRFLIGESLMKQDNLQDAVGALLA